VAAARELAGEVVIKIQAWTTGRANIGGVAFAKGPDELLRSPNSTATTTLKNPPSIFTK